MQTIDLSVIIPIYNEGECLAENLGAVIDFLSTQELSWEVIAVNDGSSDHSPAILEEFTRNWPAFRVVSYPLNRGKGYAVKQGMLTARGGIRLFMDADLSTPLHHITEAIALIRQGYDLTMASRRLEGAHLAVRQTRLKESLGIVGNWGIRKLLGLSEYRDTQCGFKALTADLTLTIFPKLQIDRWGFDFELIALAVRGGARIRQFPITWRNRADSRVTMGAYLRTLGDLLRLKSRIIRGVDGQQA